MLPLSEDHIEALTELLNLGMGQAGAALGQLFNTFVRLNVPSVSFVSPDVVALRVKEMVGSNEVSAVRQGFHDGMHGETVVIYNLESSKNLARLMDVEEDDDISETELLLEVTNVYTGACLFGIASQLQKQIAFYPPAVAGINVPVESLFGIEDLRWEQALLTQIVLELKEHSISNNILIFLPDDSCSVLRKVLDQYIESF